MIMENSTFISLYLEPSTPPRAPSFWSKLKNHLHKKPPVSSIPESIQSKLDDFPSVTSKTHLAQNQNLRNEFPFFYYRRLGYDLYQAIGYAFFEQSIRNREKSNLERFQNDAYFLFKENSEELAFRFENLPNTKEAYMKAFLKFKTKVTNILAEMEIGENSTYYMITEFYKNLEDSGAAPFFEIFLRGYIIGRGNFQNEAYWNKRFKNKNDFKNFFKFNNANSFNSNDLNLIHFSISNQIQIYSLENNQNGDYTDVHKLFYPSSQTQIVKKNIISLLFNKDCFYCLNLSDDYDPPVCFSSSCKERRFSHSFLIPCTNKHYLCLYCFVKDNFPSRCKKKFCTPGKYNPNKYKIFFQKAKSLFEKKWCCPICDFVNQIDNPKEKICVCQNCSEKICRKHYKSAEECFCLCFFCKAKTTKAGDLFKKAKLCSDAKCAAIFCKKCHFKSQKGMLCECFCPLCGCVKDDGSCKMCDKMCAMCNLDFSNNISNLQKCKKCGNWFCRNCQIKLYLKHQIVGKKDYCIECVDSVGMFG